MKNLGKYNLEIAVFVCGAVVMILELVGSRFLAPHFGTTLYVWSSIIGVILASLSVGYWLGGRVSTVNPGRPVLALIVLTAAFSILALAMVRESILALAVAVASQTDIRLGAFFAAMVMFSLPNVLLGIVSPYAARLKIDQVASSGKAVGNLYAISTAGSIAGTFAAGFWLIGMFGSEQIQVWMAAALAAVSVLIDFKVLKLWQVAMLAAAVVWSAYSGTAAADVSVKTFDTSYSRYQVRDIEVGPGLAIRTLSADKLGTQSAAFLRNGRPNDELVFEYVKYFLLGRHFVTEIKSTLMIGAGAYSFPKKFLLEYPDAAIDVVEIDPKLTEISRQYFDLRDNRRMSIYHEDGRVFLNRNKKIYDVVYIDTFSSMSIPFQMATREAALKVYGSLGESGAAMMNIVSAANGDRGKILRSLYATYRDVFPQVYVFSVKGEDLPEVSNYMLVALKSRTPPQWTNPDFELNKYLQTRMDQKLENDVPALTDDRAPMEQYVMEIMKGE
ncbi:MAG: fused MFS/spermidine synthase [Candidatus Pacebacteria bacterium]|nr:fused MFS/spermidine synthase [Candidatus Paceibacterota bacterium]